jgi:heat shock protein HslJ
MWYKVLVVLGLMVVAACASTTMKASSDNQWVGDWVLQTVTKDKATWSAEDQTTVYSISFDPEMNVTGNVACNQWKGVATVSEAGLQIASAGATKKRCHIANEQLAALEYRFLPALKQPLKYQLSGETLELHITQDETWRFQRVNGR